MYGEVAAHLSAGTCALGHAYLAYYNLAGLCLLAAGYLDPQPLSGTVMVILAGTACFNFGHLLSFPFDYDEFTRYDLVRPVIDEFFIFSVNEAQTIVTQII